jgi:hypothetical protein
MDEDAEREEAEQRIRLFPGCEAIRVVREQAEWMAVLTEAGKDESGAPVRVGIEILVRRPTLPLLVDFFEQRGGFASEK